MNSPTPLPDPADPVDSAAHLGGVPAERAEAMLAFEANWFVDVAPKSDTIRARFACSETEYNLQLSRIIDDPAALDIDPLVVRRLRRNRDRRRRAKLDGFAAAESR